MHMSVFFTRNQNVYQHRKVQSLANALKKVMNPFLPVFYLITRYFDKISCQCYATMVDRTM